MSEETGGSQSASSTLPDDASIEWLRKQAKRRLQELRRDNPGAKLADAQFALAKEYGFTSWRTLKAHLDSLTVDGQLFDAAKNGDMRTLTKLLDAHPEKLHARSRPWSWTLLHAAAHGGHPPAVELLLHRGLDPNAREKGDNTYPMHWAAAAGKLDVVRRLANADGDVVGHGDDHQLEVIGWASCWDGADDDAHRAVVDFLVSRGARHNIYSAIAMNLDSEVRRIVAENPAALEQPMSHNENFQHPLHFAVRMNRPKMVALLLELGADPTSKDGSGYTTVVYATEPGADRSVFETMRGRGHLDLIGALAIHDWTAAERLLNDNHTAVEAGGANTGVLHLMAKRGDVEAVKWLLDHGADPSAKWSHWDADATPMHLAAWQGHGEVLRLLLDAGGDPTIHDTKHDSDVMGWAEYAHQREMVRILKEYAARS
jgi:ankyrin repeat protein